MSKVGRQLGLVVLAWIAWLAIIAFGLARWLLDRLEGNRPAPTFGGVSLEPVEVAVILVIALFVPIMLTRRLLHRAREAAERRRADAI
jgi:hypothetical protein